MMFVWFLATMPDLNLSKFNSLFKKLFPRK
jgi:hypothetical protein